ncbi:hypothetical protein KPH14_001146 [Odynerus spinipes]|uniref:Uncharacterized protein n=1 Tax=Odynerus spinipes TaxID=1348599 RepID=A0AAD9RQ76_9HYME|nr:hypothetical protein KPH14_001146 [Odynerus spinipes]
MQSVCKPDPCCCPSILIPTCPPPCPPSPKPCQGPCSKYFHQIGAEMIGNHLIIRMEKDKSKSKRKFDQWDPPCDCDIAEIQRPTKKEGPKILKGGDDRILFRIRSKSHISSKDDSKPQAISYQIGSCKGGENTNDDCRTITIYPQLGLPGSQEVHTDQIIDGDENVCLLRIKKKPNETSKVKRNVELELRTPRPPTPPQPHLICIKPPAPMKGCLKRPLDEAPKKETKKKKRRKKK